jgi:hypothetical protein
MCVRVLLCFIPLLLSSIGFYAIVIPSLSCILPLFAYIRYLSPPPIIPNKCIPCLISVSLTNFCCADHFKFVVMITSQIVDFNVIPINQATAIVLKCLAPPIIELRCKSSIKIAYSSIIPPHIFIPPPRIRANLPPPSPQK